MLNLQNNSGFLQQNRFAAIWFCVALVMFSLSSYRSYLYQHWSFRTAGCGTVLLIVLIKFEKLVYSFIFILSQPMAGPVLDSLADTLVSHTTDVKSKTDKTKVIRGSVICECKLSPPFTEK